MAITQQQVDDLLKELADRIAADTKALVRLNLAELARETTEVFPEAIRLHLVRSDESTDVWFANLVTMADGTEEDDLGQIEDAAYDWTVGYTGYAFEDAASDIVVFDNGRHESTIAIDLNAAVAALQKEH